MFSIHFRGVVAFVTPEAGRRLAVLPAAPDHAPRLQVSDDDLLEADGFSRDAAGHFRLDGESLTIEGLQPHSPAVPPSDPIVRREPHLSVAAYVEFPEGELAQLTAGTVLRARATAETVTVRAASGKFARIRGEGTIHICNESSAQPSGDDAGHFRYLYRL